MQNVGSSLSTILSAIERDLLDFDLYEFYPPDETCLFPQEAEKLFAASTVVWYGYTYEQQAIGRSDISRYIDGKFNNCTITLSNVDRTVSDWLSGITLEGYRVVIRCISRSVDDDSIVLGVFRCEKVDQVDNKTIQIQAKQDLGSIENDLPWNKFGLACPLEFKQTECLAGQLLTDKSAAMQAASICNKSKRQCYEDYDNDQAFQGEFFNVVTGNFKVSQRRGGAGGAVLSLIGLGNKRVTKQYSSQDDASQGQVITLGLGRTQVELLASEHADTGQYLAGQWIIGEGPVQAILNLRNVTSGWADTFQALATHKGEYGFNTEQTPAGFFANQRQFHSHKAYVEATIKGDNPDTGDPAPTLAAVILWIKIPTWDGKCFEGTNWSDNPVEQLRFLLTETRSLDYSTGWIDDVVAGETVEYCNDPLIDQTGGEDIYISQTAGTPGTTYKRYRSTGLLDTYYWRKVLGLSSTFAAEREATVNTFNPASAVTPVLGTYYRKRFTSNWHLREATKAIDFIFKSLLPSFNGYLITSAQGKLQIRSQRPALTTLLQDATIVTATAVNIEDALAWRNLNLPFVYCIVGVGLSTSETRRVSSVVYDATAGDSITLTASGSASASGATFSGGSSDVQSEARVTIGSVAAGTVVIDGVSETYTPNADDTTGTIAAILTTQINANTTLNRYMEALWSTSNPTKIILRSKLGTLNLSSGLSYTHAQGVTIAQVHLPFSDVSLGALTRGNISRDGFSWPLGSKQSSYNQFSLTFNDAPQDFQSTELRENDYEHQRKINKINKLEISGACVDNYSQANRLVVGSRFKYREGDYFVQLSTTDARALLLEEGDLICATHSNQPNQRNLMLRIEELKVSPKHQISITGRLYADAQFPTEASERTVPLTTGIGWPSNAPGPVIDLALTSPASGTVRGTFTFSPFVGGQVGKIEVLRFGDSSYSDTGIRVIPDSDNNGAFEISGLPAGRTYVRVTPISSTGVEGPSTIAVIFGVTDVIEAQVFSWGEDELSGFDEDVLEVEVFS